MQLSEDVEVLELPPSNKKQSDHRAGVFSCSSSSNGSTRSILVINHRKNSNVLPNGFVTKTVNVGDSVTLSIESHSSKVKWRKGGVEISQWNGLKSITLNNVTVEDDGIYEAYTCRHSPHAYMRLIVRDFRYFYLIFIDITVCICYNGGVCSSSQNCICPPGFSGDSCENGKITKL
ncbi:Tyrosine-protein kinase receptor Tie-1 [Holothuria leucospilota]|uniref:Tyrosine-protein kinase receptor Tie-1 n=1 Tax=Holothuria leucospilota TaxID=206669 RepID=A0A9Q1BTB0_HOLLE|nr:Tyrosine-protein kinase receptor Tie-1 [Holothuria leucospilota]